MTAKEKHIVVGNLTHPGPYYARAANGNYIPSRSTIPKEPYADVRNTGEDNSLHIPISCSKQRHWAIPTGIAMCSVLVGLMFWQYTIVPAWTHYQEQLDCGTGHVCIAAVTVSPRKTRIFVAMLYNARIMVYEMPDANNADGHIYPGAVIYSGVDWRTITPHIQVTDVNKDGYQDIVIISPDFEGANPVLYNQGDGTFSWQEASGSTLS